MRERLAELARGASPAAERPTEEQELANGANGADADAAAASATGAPTARPPAAPPEPEEQELAEPEEERQPGAPDAVERVLIPRWVQLVVVPLLALLGWALIKAAGKVILLFIIAALIALILNPAVAFLQRRRLPRGLAVLGVYLAFFLTVGGIGVLLANPVSNQVSSFAKHVPHIVNSANKQLASFQHTLNSRGIHVQFIKQGKTALQTLQEKVVKGAGSIVSFGGDLLTKVVSVGFDLVLIFVLSVYMLLYGERMGSLVRQVMPTGDGTPADDYPTLVGRAVTSYVRGQLLFSAIMGTTAGVALYLFGVIGIFPDGRTYAVAFGAFLALMELIPYVGPILGALPPVLVALFTDPISALWVGLLFLGLQQFEGHIVAPQVFSHSLRINPLLVMFGLLVGETVYGIVGALVALPILAVLRETVMYLSRHVKLEPWNRSPDALL